MIILGIDPGTQKTGYGLIQKSGNKFLHIDNGLIVLNPKTPMSDRLQEIFAKTCALIKEFQPQALALEDVFIAKNVRSILKLGHARGVVLLAASLTNTPVFEYSPSQVKLAIASFGHASKEQMQKMVRLHLNLKEVAAEDASDALAIALCHCQTKRFEKESL